MAEWSIAAVLKTVEGHTSGGSNPSLSAINLENQGITKSVHDLVHESPIFGAFLLSFPNKGWNKEARTNRASNIVPQRELWLSQQCGCKDTAFLENPP